MSFILTEVDMTPGDYDHLMMLLGQLTVYINRAKLLILYLKMVTSEAFGNLYTIWRDVTNFEP